MTPVVVYPHVEFISFNGANGHPTPVVSGTRIPVSRLWSFVQRGTTFDTLFLRYPQLSRASILSAIAFAYDNPDIIDTDLSRRAASVEAPQ